MSDLRENLDLFYKKIGNSKGLSPQSMSNDVTGQSGVAKHMIRMSYNQERQP